MHCFAMAFLHDLQFIYPLCIPILHLEFVRIIRLRVMRCQIPYKCTYSNYVFKGMTQKYQAWKALNTYNEVNSSGDCPVPHRISCKL